MTYQPAFLGRKIINPIDLSEIATYIDWTFFFHTWGIAGKYPGIEKLCDCSPCQTGWLLQFAEKDRPKAEEALKLFRDARKMLQTYITEKKIFSKAVLYFSKVRAENDGILFLPESENEKSLYLPMLRQQKPNERSGFCYSLADFISPKEDYIGAFAVTIQGAEKIAADFRKKEDEYNEILIKSLADRLAEATSEWLHEQVRKKYWGYAPDEKITVDELRKVPYQGIRPAIGYPSMPDQSLIFEVDQLLNFSEIEIRLTENGVMIPSSSICGLYFAHPASIYFMIGKIGEDQLKDYARRRNQTPEEMKKWLAKVITG